VAILEDIRVVDFSSEIAGPYATKMFADAGADVVKIESPAGDPLRKYGMAEGDSDSALFRYLNGSKRSVVGDWSDAGVRAIVDGADLLVESSGPKEYDYDLLRIRNPGLVVLTLTPFGTEGPWADRPGNDFIVQAESGAIAMHGYPTETPYQMGARIVEWCAGTFGAVSALAAIECALKTGQGEHIDLPHLLASSYSSLTFMDAMHQMIGAPTPDTVARFVDLPSIEPTLDGWVGFKVFTRDQFEAFCILIDRPDLLVDERWASSAFRGQRINEWNDMVHPWTMKRTTAEIVELASALRIPATAVNSAMGVLNNEHFVDRDLFVTSPDGSFMYPRPAPQIWGERLPKATAAPTLGEHTGMIEDRPRVDQIQPTIRSLPLEGVRVLDFTTMWAGPSAGEFFALLGADVIHIEGPSHLDGTRTFLLPPQIGTERWWERAGAWLSINRNKRSLAMAIDTPEGQSILRNLMATADVMFENYSPRVLDGFGFDAESVAEINPNLVYVRMPAFGLTGPWRERTGFTQTMEQATGMAWLTGYPEGPPRIANGPCDALAGYQAAFGALLGLHDRQRRGQGGLVEVAMIESALNVAAELVVTYTGEGKELQRQGNRSLTAAPQGIYPCLGVEKWLAISIETDDQWLALRRIMGDPPWATKPNFDTFAGRRELHDLIDDEIGNWARSRELFDTVEALSEAGVLAGSVTDPRLAPEHPQLLALGYYETLDHPVVGPHLMPSVPFRFASVDHFGTRRAPLLGEHNEEILESLGFTPQEIESLRAKHVIGDWPVGA
jgi:crotonobetainyl-CoA:carnitine CoA-transferase CaiB-like acyl-CoA transferase